MGRFCVLVQLKLLTSAETPQCGLARPNQVKPLELLLLLRHHQPCSRLLVKPSAELVDRLKVLTLPRLRKLDRAMGSTLSQQTGWEVGKALAGKVVQHSCILLHTSTSISTST